MISKAYTFEALQFSINNHLATRHKHHLHSFPRGAAILRNLPFLLFSLSYHHSQQRWVEDQIYLSSLLLLRELISAKLRRNGQREELLHSDGSSATYVSWSKTGKCLGIKIRPSPLISPMFHSPLHSCLFFFSFTPIEA